MAEPLPHNARSLAFRQRRDQICLRPSPGIPVTIPPTLADALRDRYVLDRELGRGGMATVYLAQDLRHLSPGWLRIDPTWSRLKDNPRFKRLAASG